MNKNKDNRNEDKDEDLPGYPHYPSNEDVTRPENNNGIIEGNVEEILLPDVKDIPGQENIKPAPLGELADTTISSDDEEDVLNGTSLDKEEMVDEDEEIKIVMGTEADVTDEDLRLLDGDSFNADLDDVDEDFEPLEERTDTTLNPGEDLDVPGSEADDADEAIGEEDEENNYYSLGGDNNDDLEHGE